ncbi:MAG: hypothetical protein VKJ64_07470, partial [Leptolyngbyaceae bacterium]|nr:hypothetical protein [Leptolyngbyaceae bacterium]
MLVSAFFQTIWASLKWVVNPVYKYVKTFVKNGLRYLLCLASPSLRTQQGFILPTTVLLLLVVTLTVGAMTLRTLNRTGQVIGDRQQRVIYNAATPAMERGKAKLEFMFDSQRDTRYPAGVPDQDFLYSMMLNDGTTGSATKFEPFGTGIDPYTFPDDNGDYTTDEAESRVDIDGDDKDDNAWSYRVDLDENGELDATVIYSILFNKPPEGSTYELKNASDEAVQNRAEVLQVRHGPLSVPIRDDGCAGGGGSGTSGASADNGWSKPESGGATLYKNFQINALVIPDDGSAAATLELHQDRKIDEGNKWGAWFRNDIEVFPGAKFNWNGAMHTEGGFFVARGVSNKPALEAYLISSPASCYYSREDSEITVADRNTTLQDNNFQGQFVVSKLETNIWNNSHDAVIHLFDPDGNIQKPTLDRSNDSVVDGGGSEQADSYLLDPVVLLTQDTSKARGAAFASNNPAEDGNPLPGRDPNWIPENSDFLAERRLYNQTEATPSVDDSFRADNRYGPKPRVNGQTIPGDIGATITGDALSPALTDDDLIRLGSGPDDEAGDYTNVGLDGYWERRARSEGMRVIVGQRLDLGNTFGWGSTEDDGTNHPIADATDNEPLMPWNDCDTENPVGNGGFCAEARQRRSLRDNLAAVQAATVYHANATGVDKDFPVACLANTVHPGTASTLAKSGTFLNWLHSSTGPDTLAKFWDHLPSADRPELFISDFFRGEGTNGWEYETPGGGTPTGFASALAPAEPLGKAMRNLAHYAGDPFAGAPSFTPQQDTLVHPYPLMSMWGDFSVLRRIFDDELDNGGYSTSKYNNLSPADKTTLQT